MRYPGSEKLEIIGLVEHSHLPVRRTLATLGILPMTFYRWYARLQAGGPEALEDKPSRPRRVWNKIPEEVREQIVELALDEPELSPREVATRFTDVNKYFVSEASVYRLLKAHDLITSPAFIVVKAADEFKDKTTAPNQLWQTDFTYLKVIGWGWFYLSTILDDFSRYIIAWKLCTTMKAQDVTETLELALKHQAARAPRSHSDHAAERQRFLLHRRRSGGMAQGPRHQAHPGRSLPSPDPGQDRALAPDVEEPHPLENYYLPGDLETQIDAFVDHYNHQRYHEAIGNLTPADVYFGRGNTILLERERIKRQTIQRRRLNHRAIAA